MTRNGPQATAAPRILGQVTLPPGPCSYLPDEEAALTYRQIASMTPEQFERYLVRGWRRHGCHFFRPSCPACVQCRSLRVDVDRFEPTRSQRRCWRRNADVEVELGTPQVTAAHIDLYNRYHADMQARRQWPHRVTTSREYAESFLLGNFAFAHEVRYYRGQELIGVGLVDLTPTAGSSVYFYHDPVWRAAGPGTFSLLAELQILRQLGRSHHYLGYWIAPCGSMAYKSRFGPHQLLRAYVSDDETPEWEDVVSSQDADG